MLNAQNIDYIDCNAATTTTQTTTTTNSCHRVDKVDKHFRHNTNNNHVTPLSWGRLGRLPILYVSTFLQMLLFLLLTTTILAAPQSSCILCDKNDLQPKDLGNSETYEEFLFDHQVSRQDAIHALRTFNETYGATQKSCDSEKCTSDILKYCLGPQFINDHCWCELQHVEEGVPYVPHICYVGEKVYKPSVGSCFLFEEVKECCCASALAREWRHISGSNSTVNPPKIMMFYILIGVLLSLLFHRQR